MLVFRIKQLSKISVVNTLTSLERTHMLLPAHMSVFHHFSTIFYILGDRYLILDGDDNEHNNDYHHDYDAHEISIPSILEEIPIPKIMTHLRRKGEETFFRQIQPRFMKFWK